MKAVFLLNLIRSPRSNTSLRTFCLTGSAADAAVGDYISLFLYCSISQRINLAENRIDTEIKVFDISLIDAKDDADITGVAGIDIGEIRLFFEDFIPPVDLPGSFHCPARPERRIISLYFV